MIPETLMEQLLQHEYLVGMEKASMDKYTPCPSWRNQLKVEKHLRG